MTQLVKKIAVKDFQCDDDYMWRDTDIMFRTVIEKSGFRWKRISTTEHINNETDGVRYSSDNTKNFTKIKFSLSEKIVIDKKKFREMRINQIKGRIKYIDPESKCQSFKHTGLADLLNLVDRKWVEENGPSWLKYYDKYRLTKFRKMKKLFSRKGIKYIIRLLRK